MLAYLRPLSVLLEAYSRHELKLVAQGFRGFSFAMNDVDGGKKAALEWCFSSQLGLKRR